MGTDVSGKSNPTGTYTRQESRGESTSDVVPKSKIQNRLPVCLLSEVVLPVDIRHLPLFQLVSIQKQWEKDKREEEAGDLHPVVGIPNDKVEAAVAAAISFNSIHTVEPRPMMAPLRRPSNWKSKCWIILEVRE